MEGQGDSYIPPQTLFAGGYNDSNSDQTTDTIWESTYGNQVV